MATLWLVRRDGKTTAPLTTEQLKQCGRNGQVKPSDQIAKAGTEKWQRADTVKGLELMMPEPSRGAIAVPDPPPVLATANAAESTPPTAGESGEQSVWNGGPSQISNVPMFIKHGLFVLLILAFSWLLFPLALLPIPLLAIGKRWLTTRSVRYELTTERLRVTQGILSHVTQEWELYRVKDSTVSQSFFERKANLGTVSIYTSDRSQANVDLRSVESPRELREKIRSFTEKRRDEKGVREVDHV